MKNLFSQKERAAFVRMQLLLRRRRPNLPHSFPCSTLGPAGLNFRVRDGNGWNPRGKITDLVSHLFGPSLSNSVWIVPMERTHRLHTRESRCRKNSEGD